MYDMDYQQTDRQQIMLENMFVPDIEAYDWAGGLNSLSMPANQPGNRRTFTMPMHQQFPYGVQGHGNLLQPSPPMAWQYPAPLHQVMLPQGHWQPSTGHDQMAMAPQMTDPLPMTTSLLQEVAQQNWQQPTMGHEVQTPVAPMVFPSQPATPSPMITPQQMPIQEAPKRKVGRPPGSTDIRKRLERGTFKAMTPKEQRVHKVTLRDGRKQKKIEAENARLLQASESEAASHGWASPAVGVWDAFLAASSYADPGLSREPLFDDGLGNLFFGGTS